MLLPRHLIDEVFQAALYLTSDKQEAERLAEETMVRAVAAFDASREDADLRVSLHRLLHRVRIERRTRAALRTLESLSPSEIQRVLMSLPAELRMTVYYGDVAAMTYPQIAEIMSVDLETVISRLGEGRTQFRAALADALKPAPRNARRSAQAPSGHELRRSRLEGGTSRDRANSGSAQESRAPAAHQSGAPTTHQRRHQRDAQCGDDHLNQ